MKIGETNENEISNIITKSVAPARRQRVAPLWLIIKLAPSALSWTKDPSYGFVFNVIGNFYVRVVHNLWHILGFPLPVNHNTQPRWCTLEGELGVRTPRKKSFVRY